MKGPSACSGGLCGSSRSLTKMPVYNTAPVRAYKKVTTTYMYQPSRASLIATSSMQLSVDPHQNVILFELGRQIEHLHTQVAMFMLPPIRRVASSFTGATTLA